MFIGNINGQAVILNDPYESEGFDSIFEVKSIPQGSGILRTNGVSLWWETIESLPIQPSIEDQVAKLQNEVKLKDAQVSVLTEQTEFLGDLIAEMATLVYQ